MHVGVLMEDGEIWVRGVWLLGGGVAWGRDWLGLRLEEVVVWGTAVAAAAAAVARLPGGIC